MQAALYTIGAGGLTRIADKPRIYLDRDQMYFLGASSSPDRVIITRLEDHMVHFRRRPFRKDERMDRRIFADLATRGENTKLKQLMQYGAAAGDATPDWALATISEIQAHLAGEYGRAYNLRNIQPIEIIIRYTGTGDAWSEWERTYPHTVSHSSLDGLELHSFDFTFGDLAKLRDNPPANFKITGFNEVN